MVGSEEEFRNLCNSVSLCTVCVHCYAHQLNLLLLYGSKSIPQICWFACALIAFHNFFRMSPKQSVLSTKKGFKLPQACTSWSFPSKEILTIVKYLSELKGVFSASITDSHSMGNDSMNCALGLKVSGWPKFCVYEKCFTH